MCVCVYVFENVRQERRCLVDPVWRFRCKLRATPAVHPRACECTCVKRIPLSCPEPLESHRVLVLGARSDNSNISVSDYHNYFKDIILLFLISSIDLFLNLRNKAWLDIIFLLRLKRNIYAILNILLIKFLIIYYNLIIILSIIYWFYQFSISNNMYKYLKELLSCKTML